MPRERNIVESVQITLSTTTQIREYLEDLTRSGFYGKNAAETAERLLAKTLYEMVKNGDLTPRRPASEPPEETES